MGGLERERSNGALGANGLADSKAICISKCLQYVTVHDRPGVDRGAGTKGASLTVDGQPIEGNTVPYAPAGSVVEVVATA